MSKFLLPQKMAELCKARSPAQETRSPVTAAHIPPSAALGVCRAMSELWRTAARVGGARAVKVGGATTESTGGC